MVIDGDKTTYRLDPSDFPKRIELELSDEIVEKISAIAGRTGRSFSEVVTDILSRQDLL
ncbi:ribbon-helix-helix protein, CopG family [Cyanobium sp. T1G-Tous]|uniref:ribbon-helix-helix protein, CopG family n=1 Tax=Cyanobium sp. T1G-Tous TaxID=2823722 RepID=UPI0037BE2BEA